ncbi:hypothetical protein E3N88_29061 [Mikania micrantha]|uniref:Non-haem dioxygenase N-terminal domain-containing protein n=1 Tax=Mikania micrantha TaxID=192012 RepID=A0A5N6N2H8_9ASTR|nr:hypothetical protein E3N88_29061 [Mikania micrantha]
MEIPMIDFSKLDGENRSKTMTQLHDACKKWGFFQIENHGVDKELMEKVKQLVNKHYEDNMKPRFYTSTIVKTVEDKNKITNTDWESTFFIWHRPDNKINECADLSEELRKAVDEYIDQLIKVAEKLSELMCENLGLHKDYIKEAFSGSKGYSLRGSLSSMVQLGYQVMDRRSIGVLGSSSTRQLLGVIAQMEHSGLRL